MPIDQSTTSSLAPIQVHVPKPVGMPSRDLPRGAPPIIIPTTRLPPSGQLLGGTDSPKIIPVPLPPQETSIQPVQEDTSKPDLVVNCDNSESQDLEIEKDVSEANKQNDKMNADAEIPTENTVIPEWGILALIIGVAYLTVIFGEDVMNSLLSYYERELLA